MSTELPTIFDWSELSDRLGQVPDHVRKDVRVLEKQMFQKDESGGAITGYITTIMAKVNQATGERVLEYGPTADWYREQMIPDAD